MINRQLGTVIFITIFLGSFLLSRTFPVDEMGQPYILSSSYLVDQEGTITVDQAHKRTGVPVLDNTRPIEGGFFDQALWVKHAFRTGTTDTYYFVEDHHINDSVQFWIYHGDSLLQESSVYGARKLRKGIIDGFTLGHYREKVTLSPDTKYEVILKVKSLFAKELSSFSIFDSYSYQTYVQQKLDKKSKIGIYYGAIGFSILFSLVLFMSNKNPVFLCYAGLAIGNLLAFSSYRGLYGNIFILFPWLNYNIPGLGHGITQLSMILYLYFYTPKQYLALWYRKLVPYLSALMGGLIIAYFIIIDSSLFFFIYANFLFILGPSMVIILIVVLGRAIKEGFTLGWWPIFAHAPFMTYIIDYLLNIIFPSYERFIYGHLVECIIFELLVLVVAMTQQYRNDMEEKLTVSKALTDLSQNYEVKLLYSQEEERKRLAREIHDGALQQLLTLKLMFRKKNNLQLQDSVLEQTMSDLRNLSHELMPSTIKEVGLKASLADFLYNRAEHFKIRIRFDFQANEQRLSHDTQNHLLRICQELIQNTLKHAEAELIDLTLHEAGDQLMIIYNDNGKGFSGKKSVSGIGFETIATRCRIIGADFSFESAEGKGFSALIFVPVEKEITN